VKIPPDSPTKVGDRVQHRSGWPVVGTVIRLVRHPTWMVIDWGETPVGHPPKICHQSELKKVEP